MMLGDKAMLSRGTLFFYRFHSSLRHADIPFSSISVSQSDWCTKFEYKCLKCFLKCKHVHEML